MCASAALNENLWEQNGQTLALMRFLEECGHCRRLLRAHIKPGSSTVSSSHKSEQQGKFPVTLQRVFPLESSLRLILDVDNSPPFFSKLLLILNTSLCLLCMNRLTVALLNY